MYLPFLKLFSIMNFINEQVVVAQIAEPTVPENPLTVTPAIVLAQPIIRHEVTK